MPVTYDVLSHLDDLEASLTPDCPFQMLHLIRACRQLLAERDGYRQLVTDLLAQQNGGTVTAVYPLAGKVR